MLMEKAGYALFYIKENNHTFEVTNKDFLTPAQEKQMSTQPDMILQYCHYIRDLVLKNAGFFPEILATVKVGINGRDYRYFLKPDIDLARIREFEPSHKWSIPFN